MLQENYSDILSSRNFKRLIYEKGHNNVSLAEATGLTESAIRNLANEKTPFNPNAKTLAALSIALETPLLDFFVYEN